MSNIWPRLKPLPMSATASRAVGADSLWAADAVAVFAAEQPGITVSIAAPSMATRAQFLLIE
ncbi:hypothetical protein D3C72_1814550 [compost metagenome]